MKRAALALLLSTVWSATAWANEDFLAKESFEVKQVAGAVPLTLDDKVWAAQGAGAVKVHAQRTIRLNDLNANAHAAKRSSWTIHVKAVHNGKDLAVLLEWADGTRDLFRTDETDSFGDSVAIEFPVKFGAGQRLPYVGMGDEGSPVYLYMHRATDKPNVILTREMVAAGFASSTRADVGGVKGTMAYDGKAKVWRALFVRPLDVNGQSLKAGVVPFALAAWDGGRNERGGNKALSKWKFMRLAGFKVDPAYVNELAWGHGATVDLVKGKALVEGVCVACHRIGDKQNALESFAPDLTHVGVISTPSYLRDSVMDPSAVVVPSYNFNRHYARAGTPDAYGAYPNNDTYKWYTLDAAGKKVSRMPAFAHLTPEDVVNIVGYLGSMEVAP
jgi:DMSO reductase family type II enzyme heme b subunit